MHERPEKHSKHEKREHMFESKPGSRHEHPTEHKHETKHEHMPEHKGMSRHEPQKEESKSLRYAHWINSPEEHESHHGESLATKNHEVIKRWAEARKATPATVPGTEHEGRPGVLRFDFPGFGGQELQHISWEEWFKTFDARDLAFVFQETLKDGRQSNFFHLDSPHREHD